MKFEEKIANQAKALADYAASKSDDFFISSGAHDHLRLYTEDVLREFVNAALDEVVKIAKDFDTDQEPRNEKGWLIKAIKELKE